MTAVSLKHLRKKRVPVAVREKGAAQRRLGGVAGARGKDMRNKGNKKPCFMNLEGKLQLLGTV